MTLETYVNAKNNVIKVYNSLIPELINYCENNGMKSKDNKFNLLKSKVNGHLLKKDLDAINAIIKPYLNESIIITLRGKEDSFKRRKVHIKTSDKNSGYYYHNAIPMEGWYLDNQDFKPMEYVTKEVVLNWVKEKDIIEEEIHQLYEKIKLIKNTRLKVIQDNLDIPRG